MLNNKRGQSETSGRGMREGGEELAAPPQIADPPKEDEAKEEE
jgi:hypothetical protein